MLTQPHLPLPASNRQGHAMSEKTKPTHEQPGSCKEDEKEDGVVNDSLGTIDPADSTGTDEDKDTGDAKKGNTNTRED
jgi:hypothetical protein